MLPALCIGRWKAAGAGECGLGVNRFGRFGFEMVRNGLGLGVYIHASTCMNIVWPNNIAGLSHMLVVEWEQMRACDNKLQAAEWLGSLRCKPTHAASSLRTSGGHVFRTWTACLVVLRRSGMVRLRDLHRPRGGEMSCTTWYMTRVPTGGIWPPQDSGRTNIRTSLWFWLVSHGILYLYMLQLNMMSSWDQGVWSIRRVLLDKAKLGTTLGGSHALWGLNLYSSDFITSLYISQLRWWLLWMVPVKSPDCDALARSPLFHLQQEHVIMVLFGRVRFFGGIIFGRGMFFFPVAV